MYTYKERVRVAVLTSSYRIIGNLYMLPGSRIIDMLNAKGKDFIPVTDVVVMHPYEDKVYTRKEFICVNRRSIELIFPLEEEKNKEQEPAQSEAAESRVADAPGGESAG